MKKLNLIFSISLLALSVLVAIMSIYSFIKINNSDYFYLKSLGINWSKGPVVSIINRSSTCEKGEEAILNDYWPGTVSGCDCSNQFSLFGTAKLKRGVCSRSKNSGERYCRDVTPIKPIQFSVWDKTALCGKRIDSNYLDMQIVERENDCVNGTKSCGKVDSLGNILCVKSDQICPINYIEILPTNQVPKETK